MKNPYIRSVLFLSLLFSFLYTILTILSFYSVLSNFDTQSLEMIQYIFILPMLPLFMALGLLFGIALELIGPILVFLSWFVIFYLVTYLYSQIAKKDLILSPRKNTGLVIFCIVSVILLSGVQQWSIRHVGGKVNAMTRGSHIALISVSPNPASNGDLLVLNGSGFSQKGSKEIVVWLVDKPNNKYGFLWIGESPSDTTLTIPLKTTGLCNNALQNPCGSALQDFLPGQYTIEIRGGSNDTSLPITIN